MKKINLISAILTCFIIFSFQSCKKDDNTETVFKWSEQYIAGKLSPTKASNRYSSFMILLDDAKSGQLISSTKVFDGVYEVKKDSLIFRTKDKEKWFMFKLDDNKITSSHYEVRFYKKDGTYKPAPVSYKSTFYQAKRAKDNQFLGNKYVGNLHKLFTSGVFKKDYTIYFESSGHSYESGSIAHIHYKTYGNVAFRSQEKGRKEFGVLIDGKLVISAVDSKGFSYWGTFDKSK